jgi:hypothetical protein
VPSFNPSLVFAAGVLELEPLAPGLAEVVVVVSAQPVKIPLQVVVRAKQMAIVEFFMETETPHH